MYFIASSFSEWSRLRRTADEERDTLARIAALGAVIDVAELVRVDD
jgi:hypothetical protein